MTAEVSLAGIRERQLLKRARITAMAQSLVIFLLLVGMSEDYSHNQFMQAWVAGRFGGLGFLLNGTLAAFYGGLMIAYYLAPAKDNSGPRLKKTEELLAGSLER